MPDRSFGQPSQSLRRRQLNPTQRIGAIRWGLRPVAPALLALVLVAAFCLLAPGSIDAAGTQQQATLEPTPPVEDGQSLLEGSTPNSHRTGVFRYFFPDAQLNPSAVRGHGIVPTGNESFSYVLQEGDNLADLALELSRDMDVMSCVTPSSSYALSDLRPGQTIVVPGPQYLCHVTQPGETLAQIAELYQVSADVIVATPWNELSSADAALAPGQRLLILDGVRPEITRLRSEAPPGPTPTPEPEAPSADPPAEVGTLWPYGDGHFIWPVRGAISQEFHATHRGLDIAAPLGKDVVAADNGVVKTAGWSDIGYGFRVIIDHNIDYITQYAHLAQILVEEGQVVQKGQLIGRIGSTGNSTGPHLHFELRDFGYLIDPVPMLGE